MISATQFVHGTIDFVFGAAIPRALDWATKRFVQGTVFRDRTRFVKGSPWLLKRMLAKPEADISTRAVHVPSEAGMIRLKDRGQTRNVEYVVQEHLAEKAGRHFDLRLHLNGKAVSWAIPMKGKRTGLTRMPKPGERFLAIRQPDHTQEYSRFSGTIYEGLGKGTVKIWASGIADVHKIEDGNVHFEIFSGPAKGAYVLVDTSSGSLPKTARAGLLISKKPEVVDVWTKPAYVKREAERLGEYEASGEHVAERKVDGASVEVRIETRKGDLHQKARAFSHRISRRSGVLIEHTSRLSQTLPDLPRGLGGTRLRGEAWHPRGVSFLSGTLNSDADRARRVQRVAGPIRIDIFDITHHEGRDVRALPYAERRKLYVDVTNRLSSPHIQPVRQVKSNFSGFYEQQVNLKGAPTDGIVVKRQDAAYPGIQLEETQSLRGTDRAGDSGSRTPSAPPWIKVKPSDLADCVVVGFSEGEGKHTGRLGALTCETPEGHRVQVGTGFTDWERQWVWDHRNDMEVGEVARVAFHVRSGERTSTGPRFVDFHPDKSSEASLKMYADALDAA